MSAPNPYAITIQQASTLVLDVLKARLVPMLHSAPGMGKSTLIKEIAAKLNLKLIDVRLSTYDPADLNGFASKLPSGNKAGYLPMETFPLETDTLPLTGNMIPDPKDPTKQIPETYRGWLLFFDEFTSAPPSIQAAAYRPILDHEVGNHKLHPKCLVACAGNRTIDNAVAFELGTASQSRLVHFEIRSDLEQWVAHATAKNWDRRIIDFIQWKGTSMLNNFDPSHQDYTFACERTWEFVHKIISQKGFENAIPMDKLPILVGTVGPGVAVEFQAYTQIYAGLMTFADILANPSGVPIDTTRPDIIFALTGRVVENATAANIGALMPFINRLQTEFQVLTMTPILQKNPSIASPGANGVKEVSQWVVHNTQRLMGAMAP